MTSPWVVAHRGASAERPENTLSAFDEALAQGCDGIELDVQLTRDEVPVVHHDSEVIFRNGERRRIVDLAAAELGAIRPGGVDPIPTLREVLARYAGRTRLLVELKSAGRRTLDLDRGRLAARVCDLIREGRSPGDIYLLSFDARVLEACADRAPGIARVLNVRPGPVPGIALRRRVRDLFAVSADIRTLTTAFGRSIERQGCHLLAYTCNGPRQVSRALAAGVLGIMTDRPRWLADELRRKGMVREA